MPPGAITDPQDGQQTNNTGNNVGSGQNVTDGQQVDGSGNQQQKSQNSTQQQNNQQAGDNQNQDFDNPNWDTQTRDYIQSLRQESAKYRTKARGFEDQLGEISTRQQTFEDGIKKALGMEGNDMPPEQQIEQLGAQNEGLQLQNEILSLAMDSDIPKSGLDYFQFLLGQKMDAMEEGDELTDEDLTQIAMEVKQKSGVTTQGNGTSVNGNGNGNGQPNPNNQQEVTLDQFCLMGISDKSLLYQRNPDLYAQLKNQAVAANRFV